VDIYMRYCTDIDTSY